MTTQKWAGLASFALAVTVIAAPLILVTGPTQPLRLSIYDVADFLGGPVWSASLITLVYVLKERIGENAPHRLSLALLAAAVSAGASMAAVAIRTANRQYLAAHPGGLSALIAWTTVLSGLAAGGRHFLGWSLILLGWAGWTSRQIPRLLSALYVIAGIPALFVYLMPELDATVVLLVIPAGIGQGIWFWLNGASPARAQPESLNESSKLAG